MRQVAGSDGVVRHLGGWRRDRVLPRGADRVMAAPGGPQPPCADLPLMDLVPVYDQGQLGSCTANMGCTMFRYLEVRSNRPALDVSRMFLYKATRMVEGVPLAEDSGAEIRDVMKALRKHGVALEKDDPYIDDGRQFTLPPTSIETVDALGHQAIFYYRLLDLFTIKASILQGFPIGFGTTIFASFMSDEVARTGLAPFPREREKDEGGHALTIRGYDDDKVIDGEKGALLVRNSWGEQWGQGGNFWLPYRYVTSGLASDFWTLRSCEL